MNHDALDFDLLQIWEHQIGLDHDESKDRMTVCPEWSVRKAGQSVAGIHCVGFAATTHSDP